MRKDQIHLLGFNCAHNVVCLYFHEEPLGFDRRATFRMNTRKNRGHMKPRELEEDKQKKGMAVQQESTAVQRRQKPHAVGLQRRTAVHVTACLCTDTRASRHDCASARCHAT